MTLCNKCGAGIAPNESFCGRCGAELPHENTPARGNAGSEGDAKSAAASNEANLMPGDSTWQEKHNTDESAESQSFGATSRAGEERRPKPKALAAGKVLNHRYEIVKRIGGGGMGAVYLAKDRNLGEASRAVKEMIESHIDESQHEKAIADFKRESLLLTSLEHPSIPTVYDYFYDDNSERFYLVMKFIPGIDLPSCLRKRPGSRLENPTVTDRPIQTADVLA